MLNVKVMDSADQTISFSMLKVVSGLQTTVRPGIGIVTELAFTTAQCRWGSMSAEAIFPMEAPNGIGLSPDERTLYVAETPTGRLWAYPLSGPGQIR